MIFVQIFQKPLKPIDIKPRNEEPTNLSIVNITSLPLEIPKATTLPSPLTQYQKMLTGSALWSPGDAQGIPKSGRKEKSSYKFYIYCLPSELSPLPKFYATPDEEQAYKILTNYQQSGFGMFL